MGIFDKAIPNYVINDGKVVITKPEDEIPYIDDIFDPVFNKSVREALLARSNGSFGTAMVRGYGELLKNTFTGHNDQWGIFGPGMGILSTFGRSMDKADDFILGAMTESIKGLSGQGAQNPLKRIFVEDQDYTGKGLLAAAANTMSPLVGGARVDESDFKGLWNVPGMAVELATDPGIMGGAVSRRLLPKTAQKATASELLANLGKADAKTAVGTAAKLLSDYDDIMTRIAIDATAPGLRPLIKRFGSSVFRTIGPESARDIADVELTRHDEFVKQFDVDPEDVVKGTDIPDTAPTVPDSPPEPTVAKTLQGELDRQQMKSAVDGKLHFGAVAPEAAEAYSSVYAKGADELSAKAKTFEEDLTKRLFEDTAGVEANVKEWIKTHDANVPIYDYEDIDQDILESAIDDVVESYTKKGELPPTWLLAWSRNPTAIDAKALFDSLIHDTVAISPDAPPTKVRGLSELTKSATELTTATHSPYKLGTVNYGTLRNRLSDRLSREQKYADWYSKQFPDGKVPTQTLFNVLEDGTREYHEVPIYRAPLTKQEFANLKRSITVASKKDPNAVVPKGDTVITNWNLGTLTDTHADAIDDVTRYSVIQRVRDKYYSRLEQNASQILQIRPSIYKRPEVMVDAADNIQSAISVAITEALKNGMSYDPKVDDIVSKINTTLDDAFSPAALERLVRGKDRFTSNGADISDSLKSLGFSLDESAREYTESGLTEAFTNDQITEPLKVLLHPSKQGAQGAKEIVDAANSFSESFNKLADSIGFNDWIARANPVDEISNIYDGLYTALQEYTEGIVNPDMVSYLQRLKAFTRNDSRKQKLLNEFLANIPTANDTPSKVLEKFAKTQELTPKMYLLLQDARNVAKNVSADFASPYRAVSDIAIDFDKGFDAFLKDRTITPKFKKSIERILPWLDDEAAINVQHVLSKGIQSDEDVVLLTKVADSAYDAFDKLHTLSLLKSIDTRIKPFISLSPEFTGDTALMNYMRSNVYPTFKSTKDIYDFVTSATKAYTTEKGTKQVPLFEFIPSKTIPSSAYKDIVGPARDILQQVYKQQDEMFKRTFEKAYSKAYKESLDKLSKVVYPKGTGAAEGKLMYTGEALKNAAARVAHNTAENAVANLFNTKIWGVKTLKYNGVEYVFDEKFLAVLKEKDPTTYKIINGLVDRWKGGKNRKFAPIKGYSLSTLRDLRKIANGEFLDTESHTMKVVRDAWKTKLNNYVSWNQFNEHAFSNVPAEMDRTIASIAPNINYSAVSVRQITSPKELHATPPTIADSVQKDIHLPELGIYPKEKSPNFSKINGFGGQFRFLSTMYQAPFKMNGRTFRNVEAAYRAMLFPEYADVFATLDGPAAKKFSTQMMSNLPEHTPYAKYMMDVLRERYKHPEFRQRLVDTQFAKLINVNNWTDSFWGVSATTKKGKNVLGRMLETLRDEFMVEDLCSKIESDPKLLEELTSTTPKKIDFEALAKQLGMPFANANEANFKHFKHLLRQSQSVLYQRVFESSGELAKVEDALAEIAKANPQEFSEAILPEHAATVSTASVRNSATQAVQDVQEFVEHVSFNSVLAEQAKKLGMDVESYGENAPYSVHRLISDQAVSRHNAKGGASHILNTPRVKKLVDDVTKLSHDAKHYQRFERMLQLTDSSAGDFVKGSDFIAQLIASDGILAIPIDKASKSGVEILTRNVKKINSTLGTDAIIIETVETASKPSVLRIRLNQANRTAVAPLLKRMKEFLKDGTFEDFAFVDVDSKAAKELEKLRAANPDLDSLQKTWASVQGEYYKMLGFEFENANEYIPHMRRINPIVATQLDDTVYKGLSQKDRADLSEMAKTILSNSQELRGKLNGALGSSLYGRRLRGTLSTYKDFADGISVFKTDPMELVTGSFSEGTLHNSEFQTFVDLITNDNYKISQYFRTPEELSRVFTATLEDGSASGNMAALVIASPKYNESGRLIGFKMYDPSTRKGLEQALADENSILCARSVIARMDAICKKEARMAHSWFRAVAKLTTPFKLGCLINPGFLLSNFSDAAIKQAITMADKYGTSVTEELSNIARAYADIMDLNNRFSEVFDRYIGDLKKMKLLTDGDKLYSSLLQGGRSRKLFNNYAASVRLSQPIQVGELKFKPSLSVDDINIIQVWQYLNGRLPTLNDNLQDLGDAAKTTVKFTKKYEPRNVLEKILYGTWDTKNDRMTWGLVSNNPAMRAAMNGSEDIERIMRATAMVNDLRHAGMPLEELEKHIAAVSGGSRSKEAVKVRVQLEQALNTMNAINFNYDNVGDLLNAATYALPFPTFYLKNIAYWMDILERNPSMIKKLLKTQNAMWDADGEEQSDKFVAEAKGRGALAFGDVDSERPLGKFFKGIYKPTPLQSMFGAFSAIQNPVESLTARVNPLFTAPVGAIAGSTQGPESELTALLGGTDSVKYRPYNTKRFQRNVRAGDENFNGLRYMFHRINPFDRTINNALRIPEKAKHGEMTVADLAPSVFQPRFK